MSIIKLAILAYFGYVIGTFVVGLLVLVSILGFLWFIGRK